MFRKFTSIFEYDFANRTLAQWVVWGFNYFRLPSMFHRLFFLHVRLGMWLYSQWIRYWFFWFSHYLKTDTGWPQTQDKMLKNVLCPAGVWWYYKQVLFNMTPEELKLFFADNNLLNLYRRRQLRCGAVPQI